MKRSNLLAIATVLTLGAASLWGTTSGLEATPLQGGKAFDRAAAMAALGRAASAAKACKKDDGPTGAGRVKVTFAPSGSVTSAIIEGPPFAGTAVGGCVAAAFRGARVPPFEGQPVSVAARFTIN